MMGVSAHPGGVHEYGFCQFSVVAGDHAPPFPFALRLKATLIGSVCALPGEPSVVVRPGPPGLPAPGACLPRAKKYAPVVVPPVQCVAVVVPGAETNCDVLLAGIEMDWPARGTVSV